jgi:hypothetical protein
VTDETLALLAEAAAAEVDRLRAENDGLRAQLNRLVDSFVLPEELREETLKLLRESTDRGTIRNDVGESIRMSDLLAMCVFFGSNRMTSGRYAVEVLEVLEALIGRPRDTWFWRDPPKPEGT